MHEKLSRIATNILKEFPEARKLVSYGSVYQGNYRPDSDIDIAFICDDVWRGLPSDPEGLPIGLIDKINAALQDLQNSSEIRFHVPVYWESDFERGIELPSGRKLNDVGSVVYDADAEETNHQI